MAKSSKKATVAEETLLTEEQLLAMSDDDYMNDAQLAFFKKSPQITRKRYS